MERDLAHGTYAIHLGMLNAQGNVMEWRMRTGGGFFASLPVAAACLTLFVGCTTQQRTYMEGQVYTKWLHLPPPSNAVTTSPAQSAPPVTQAALDTSRATINPLTRQAANGGVYLTSGKWAGQKCFMPSFLTLPIQRDSTDWSGQCAIFGSHLYAIGPGTLTLHTQGGTITITGTQSARGFAAGLTGKLIVDEMLDDGRHMHLEAADVETMALAKGGGTLEWDISGRKIFEYTGPVDFGFNAWGFNGHGTYYAQDGSIIYDYRGGWIGGQPTPIYMVEQRIKQEEARDAMNSANAKAYSDSQQSAQQALDSANAIKAQHYQSSKFYNNSGQ
ncbi:hypothetical protein [Paraburkholderia tropica]|uniref:hypothetical protein n=1 Tax=Paraburkholderia tropica TaxID=92647 RepID=UPI003D2A9EF3